MIFLGWRQQVYLTFLWQSHRVPRGQPRRLQYRRSTVVALNAYALSLTRAGFATVVSSEFVVNATQAKGSVFCSLWILPCLRSWRPRLFTHHCIIICLFPLGLKLPPLFCTYVTTVQRVSEWTNGMLLHGEPTFFLEITASIRFVLVVMVRSDLFKFAGQCTL